MSTVDTERGARLTKARVAKGMSKADLGRAIGVSQATNDIARYEKGRGMSYERACAIAAALDVNADWLWKGTGPMRSTAAHATVAPVIETEDGLTLVTEVATQLGLDYESKGRLSDAMAVVHRKGGITREDVLEMARVLQLRKQPTPSAAVREAESQTAAARKRLAAEGVRVLQPKTRRGK